MKRILVLIMLALVAGNVALAADEDFAGEWIAVVDYGITFNIPLFASGGTGAVRPLPGEVHRSILVSPGTFFDFAVNGSKLTGSIIRGHMEEPILDGKIRGNKISFTVKETVQRRDHYFFFNGELSDDGILFSVSASPQLAVLSSKFKAIRMVQ
jgi:hypothetical protein